MTEITIITNPVLAFTQPEKFTEFLKGIRDELEAFKPDVSTAKSRGEIAAMAFRVTKQKTAIDKAGKELNADKRKEIDAVDAERRKIWDKLEALADEIRKPLTDWENAEKEREKAKSEILDRLHGAVYDPNSSESVRLAIQKATDIAIDPEIFRDETNDAVNGKAETLTNLNIALERATRHEADQAELRRLREEKEAREREEADRIAHESAERAERERAEREKEAERQAEERRQRDIQEAAEKARQDEIRKAREEAERRDREAQEKIDAANREADRIKKETDDRERARLAEEKRIRDEQEARERDKAHRGAIMKAAKESLIENGLDEPTARKIVLAIVAGEIANVKLVF